MVGFDTVFTPYDEHYIFQVYKEYVIEICLLFKDADTAQFFFNNFYVPPRNSVFARITVAFSCKDICIHLENYCVPHKDICVLSQNY